MVDAPTSMTARGRPSWPGGAALLLLSLVASADPPPLAPVREFGSPRFRSPDPVHSLVVSPDGKTLLTPAGPLYLYRTADRILAWDLDAGTARPLPTTGRLPSAVRASPDGGRLVGTVGPNTLVWDAKTGAVAQRLSDTNAVHAWFRADGGAVVVLDTSGKLVECGPDARRPVGTADRQWFTPVLAPDQSRFVVRAAGDGVRLVVHDNRTLRPVATLDPDPVGMHGPAAAFFPDARRLATATPAGGVRVWDLAAAKPTADLKPRKALGPEQSVEGLRLLVSADSRTVFAAGPTGPVRRFDVAAGTESDPLPGPAAGARDLTLAAGGRWLVALDGLGTLRRYDAATGVELPPPDGYFGTTRAAVSPDGKTVLIADGTGRLDLRDVASGRLVRTIRPPAADRPSAPVSPYLVPELVPPKPFGFLGRGERVFALEGPELAVWAVADGKPAGRVRVGVGDPPGPRFFVPTPDGRAAAVSRGDAQIALVALDSGKELWVSPKQADKGASSVHAPTFLPDGKALLAGVTSRNPPPDQKELDDTPRLSRGHAALVRLDAATGAVLGRATILPAEHQDPVQFVESLRVSADGRAVTARFGTDAFRRFDPAAGRFSPPVRKLLTGEALTADGRFLVGLGWTRPETRERPVDGRGLLLRLDPATGVGLPDLRLADAGAAEAHLLPGDRQVLVTGAGGRVALYDLPPWPADGGAKP